MKIIGGLFLFFVITVGVIVTYVIPTQYHKAIHKKYIPEYAKDMERSFKKIGFNQHQTTLTGKKSVVTIDSVSKLNPLDNHLLLNFKSLDGKTALKTKIRYEISRNIDILMEFEDYNAQAVNLISLQGPVLKVSTPFHKKLLDDKERINYLIFNTSVEFLLEKFFVSWKDPSKPDSKNEITGEKFSIGIGSSSPSPDLLLITAKLAMESASITQNNVKNDGKNFSNVIVFNSFNIPGIMESYKDLTETSNRDQKIPFLFVLMQKMPKIRKTVNFPFIFSNSIKANHAEGPSTVDLEVSIDDPEKKDMMNLLSMKFSATAPAKMLEEHATDTLSSLFSEIHAKEYYPVGKKNPLFLTGLDEASAKEKSELDKEVLQKLPLIFTTFLDIEVEGKKRALLYLDQIVSKNLLTKSNNTYSTKGEFKQMQVSVNGTLNPMATIKNLIPREELTFLMKENGLVSVYEGQTLPVAPVIPTNPQK